ncbi:unnamed protein product, partial [marine sediment metagenome]
YYLGEDQATFRDVTHLITPGTWEFHRISAIPTGIVGLARVDFTLRHDKAIFAPEFLEHTGYGNANHPVIAKDMIIVVDKPSNLRIQGIGVTALFVHMVYRRVLE